MIFLNGFSLETYEDHFCMIACTFFQLENLLHQKLTPEKDRLVTWGSNLI